jgi:hypothetical protein
MRSLAGRCNASATDPGSVSLGSNPGSATFLFICKAAVMEKARWRTLSLAESPKYVSSCNLTLVGAQLLTSPVIV